MSFFTSRQQLLLLFLATILTLHSCKKDDPDPIDPGIQLVGAPISGVNITTSFAGLVIDENKQAVSGALVRLLNQTATSDDNGVFLFKDVSVDRDWAYLKVEKSGYFHGSRSIVPTANSINSIKIMLLESSSITSLPAGSGGTVNLGSATEINFPSNAFVDEDGNDYAGTVQIAAKYLDPSSDNMSIMMPGNLEGSTTTGEYRALQTFGMVGVELTSTTGAPLQIKEDAEAQLTVNVPAGMAANAPTTIPLWYFDEEVGLWREEGEATFNGTAYVGMVKHFSFWNCDAPFPLVTLSGKVLDGNGNPRANLLVTLTFAGAPAYQAVRTGYTDSNGCFQGKVPKDEAFDISVTDECGVPQATSTVGPFSADATLPDIIMSLNNATNINGTLTDCDGNLVSEGYIKIISNNQDRFIWIDNGNFSFDIPLCGAATFDIQGVDIQNFTESPLLTYNAASNVNVGSLIACDQIAGEFMRANFFGYNNLFLNLYSSSEPNYFNIRGYDQDSTRACEFAIYSPTPIDVGTYQAEYLYLVTDNDYCYSTAGYNGELEINITTFGAVGDFIEGDFSGHCIDYNNDTTFIDGDFRTIR